MLRLLFRKVFGWYSVSMSSLLHFLEEHSIGVLATILVHLGFVTVFLIARINTTREHQGIVLEFVQEQDFNRPRTPDASELQPETDPFQSDVPVRNISVNEAEAQAERNIGKMVQDIKTELNVKDAKPVEQTAPLPEPSSKDATTSGEARVYDDQFPLNARGERTVYRGPTTVSYRLDNRRHIHMPVPAYKCQGGGTVVVDIQVNRRGYVVQASISKERLASLDPCFTDAALRAAQTARFETSTQAPEPQTGSVTYVFLPQ